MIWCGRRDSNSHGKPTRPLKPTYFLDGAVLNTSSAHNIKGKMATFRKLKSGRWQVIVRKLIFDIFLIKSFFNFFKYNFFPIIV